MRCGLLKLAQEYGSGSMSAERRVLVVDDEATICTVWWPIVLAIGRELRSTVLMMASPRSKRLRFSLALIDIMLPGLSSSNLAQAAVNDDTPVLMLSSHPEMTTKNVDRVRSSLARLKERAGALQAAMQENRRLLGESMDQSARAEGRALG
jgi:CheY-like chemotaxis protein